MKDLNLKGKKPSSTIEDYLGIIFCLERDGKIVRGVKLAKLMDVSAPTVTVTLKRMLRDNWIKINNKKEITLTALGKEAARSVIRRHMLTEWMLARIFNIPWSKVHSEAHKIEHTISKDVAIHLQKRLDNPKVCPHGNPLPGYENIAKNWIPLTSVPKGTKVIIRRIYEMEEENSGFLSFLEVNGILPGRIAIVEKILLFNDTLSIRIGKKVVTLGMKTAEKIFVEVNTA